jgi:porphobilinogen synthase
MIQGPPMTTPQAPFPASRLRRTRRSAAIRAMVAENSLTPGDLIWPVFVRDGEGVEEPVPSMPGVVRRSVDKVVEAAKEAQALGIPAICLFPYTGDENRTADCAEAWNPENLSNRATRAIKSAVPDIDIMTERSSTTKPSRRWSNRPSVRPTPASISLALLI